MKKKFKIIGICIAVLVIGIGAYGFNVYRHMSNMMSGIHEEVEAENLRGVAINIKNGEPFSVLLMGIDRDEGRGSAGRSDSMMVVTINPKEESTKILSVARDTYTEIVGRGTMDKINHAYAFGGAEMTINTVQNLLDIPIDYYAEIDMDGMKALIDVVGEVTVENNFGFDYGGSHFPTGTLRLNGDDALNYTRMRYEDPDGDFGRQARQRDVIVALANELTGAAVTRYQDIFETVGDFMKTDLTLNNLIAISTGYHKALKQVDQLELRGVGEKMNGVYYQFVPEEEVTAISTELREHLEL